MTWQIVTRLGASDQYTPALSTRQPRLFVGLECTDDPTNIANNILRVFAEGDRYPSSVALDLLTLAVSVYGADLRIKRDWADDRWTRELTLHVPVDDPDRWAKARPLVEETLAFLTGDQWSLRLRERGAMTLPPLKRRLRRTCDAVALFSGGLDSLVGAVNLLEAGRTVALVGHYGAGMSHSFQEAVLREVARVYPERCLPFLFYVQPPKQVRSTNTKAKTAKGEPTMRSRSFLFLALGIAVISALRTDAPLTVAENGLISLNVPLTGPRLGSASTRTTHPHFIALFQRVLRELDLPAAVDMPYRFMTKGEMLSAAKNQDVVRRAARVSVSCAKPEDARYRGEAPGTHCGCCVPCIIRRASLTAAGIPETRYVVDLRKKLPAPESEARLDLRAFQMALARRKKGSFTHALFNVLATGPIPPDDVREYVGVYRRGMDEVVQFFRTIRPDS